MRIFSVLLIGIAVVTFDHAGGLRTYVAQGATVITHELNKPFFDQAWARPRTLAPDLLSKSRSEYFR